MIRLGWRKRARPEPAAAGRPPEIGLNELLDPRALSRIGAEIDTLTAAGHRGLACCGVSEGVGASFMSLHIAAALARTGYRTLLIDADMRSPPEARILSSDAEGGLLPWLEAAEAGPLPTLVPLEGGLFWAPSGGVSPYAGELLLSDRFAALVDTGLRTYDMVVADTPAANRWVDARAVARVLGRAIIVTRRNVSFYDDVVTFRRELEEDGVPVAGAILNEG